MKDRKMEDIDQLFREGLNPEDTNITIPEEAWTTMVQRLNRYERRKRGVIWLIRVGSVAALILVSFLLGILITDNDSKVAEQATLENHNKIPQENKQPAADSINTPHKTKAKNQIKKTDSEQARHPESLKRANNSIKQHTLDNTLALNGKKQQNTLQRASTEATNKEKPTAGDTLQMKISDIEKSNETPPVRTEEQKPPVTEIPIAEKEKASGVNEAVLMAFEEPISEPVAERHSPQLALTVMAAPAYNGVNNLNNGSMGGDFGLLVSFEIARNWSVSTGGIYARKLYETGFSDYNPKNNIWHEYYPQKVNADCRVLDIPLNLSYTLLRIKGKTISLGTGLSSYIMLREDYRFTYEETDPENPLKYSVVNQNKHWLNVVNLQATIGQQLSKRISISLQPYMKIPLGDIGFAGVKLESMGLAANLNWNFGI